MSTLSTVVFFIVFMLIFPLTCSPGELPSFEVVCLWVAEIVMWVDNIWLALRHWSVHEPIIVSKMTSVCACNLSM